MELQALLVLAGLGVAGIAVVLLMGLFSNSGTSYEEAMAQQRKATTELLALADSKNKSKKNNKKAIKKQAKKEKKESMTAATGSEPESEALPESGAEDEPSLEKGHVEFSPSVVVDVSTDAPPNVKIRKRGKDHKVKPILVNKEDPSIVSDPVAIAASPIVTNHFEEMHPKDEFELLQATLATEKQQEKFEEVVEKKEGKPSKSKGKAPSPKSTPAVESVKEEARERHNSGESAPKEQRKNKKVDKKPVEEVIETPQEEVVPPLNAPQPSELTTEKLLKQALVNAPVPTPAPASAPAPAPVAVSTPPGGKKKKKAEPNVLSLMAGDSGGVNVNELVRVVRDASLSRNEIQILTDALLNKHHDPLPEHSDWTEGPNDPMQKLKKQLAEKEKALIDEIEASQGYQAKLKELRASLNAERARAASLGRASEQAAAEAAAAARAELHTLQARMQRLHEENVLAQEKLMLQSKLSADAESQRVQMDMHIQRLSETEAALLQQISVLQGECQAHALDASAVRETTMLTQQHVEAMAQQLQEANCAYAELEQRAQMALHGEQRAQQEVRQLQERLHALAEVQKEVQGLSARAEAAESIVEQQKAEADKLKAEADKLRGDIVLAMEGSEKFKAAAEAQVAELSNDVCTLLDQLAESETDRMRMKQNAEAQNGLPVNDVHKNAELNAVEVLREELVAAQRDSGEQREQLAQLTQQLQTYQHKNNELRTKNWKVMEALQSAEKSLQTRSSTALPAQDLSEAISKAQEAQYAEVAVVLRAACPVAAPSSSTIGRDWLQAFADNLTSELRKKEQLLEKRTDSPEASKPPPVDNRLQELQAEKENLQELVDKYKRVIDETEGVLGRLQQNVTKEEQQWARQLNEKQQELDELKQRTVLQMQKKIDALEAQLEKATNHNHSFADAERLTEERLMAGLSDQLVDSCNGPSKVGL